MLFRSRQARNRLTSLMRQVPHNLHRGQAFGSHFDGWADVSRCSRADRACSCGPARPVDPARLVGQQHHVRDAEVERHRAAGVAHDVKDDRLEEIRRERGRVRQVERAAHLWPVDLVVAGAEERRQVRRRALPVGEVVLRSKGLEPDAEVAALGDGVDVEGKAGDAMGEGVVLALEGDAVTESSPGCSGRTR